MNPTSRLMLCLVFGVEFPARKEYLFDPGKAIKFRREKVLKRCGESGLLELHKYCIGDCPHLITAFCW